MPPPPPPPPVYMSFSKQNESTEAAELTQSFSQRSNVSSRSQDIDMYRSADSHPFSQSFVSYQPTVQLVRTRSYFPTLTLASYAERLTFEFDSEGYDVPGREETAPAMRVWMGVQEAREGKGDDGREPWKFHEFHIQSVQQVPPPEEASQQDPNIPEQRNIAVSVTHNFAWVRKHLSWRRNEMSVDSRTFQPCDPASISNRPHPRDRFMNAIHRVTGVLNTRRNHPNVGQEPNKVETPPSHRCSTRRTAIIFPAWANMVRALINEFQVMTEAYNLYQRIFASGDIPGRNPDGNTEAMEDDLDNDDLGSILSEESYSPVIDALCFCRYSRLVSGWRPKPPSINQETEPASSPDKTSTNLTAVPASVKINPTPSCDQGASKGAPACPVSQGDEPVGVPPFLPRMQTKPHSQGEEVDSTYIDVQATQYI
ncbi:hypothetical protein CONPUDRAFT_146909 [Coniophora puteana RWD-64-598 SS2]|uniref:Uncharacterized protein n=1 Tax=Coniophora puteana (strain RWD-64-598) TaxID=741705 RepID=A0A5M3M9K8_CONPW|nr:uncharacterized protein CONPUDRAFT_146909 [Coniophora puteana RWD-64-598 SS2]EIW75767.1 hypothetical protein CONPUDRAFT_146909 [Coniophora puteana RWD-64-598 SS2]